MRNPIPTKLNIKPHARRNGFAAYCTKCGWCGHVHRTIEGAVTCMAKNRREARKRGTRCDMWVGLVRDGVIVRIVEPMY